MDTKTVFPTYFFLLNRLNYMRPTIQETAWRAGRVTVRREFDRKFYLAAESKRVSSFMKFGVWRRPSMFHEIDLISPSIHKDVVDLFNKTVTKQSKPVEQLANLIIEAMRWYLLRVWDENKVHIMAHSAGWDSRVISYLIWKLGLKGKIYFITLPPEIEEARSILQFEGWNVLEQHVAFERRVDFLQYYIGFNDVGKSTGDIFMHHFGRVAIKNCLQATIRKLAPEGNVQYITGFGNEWYVACSRWHRRRISKAFAAMLTFEEMAEYDHIIPWHSYEVIRTVVQHGVADFKALRNAMMDSVKPELREFERCWPVPASVTHSISEDRRAQMYQDFKNSWYFKKAKLGFKECEGTIMARRHNRWSLFFREYGKAAICEYLLNKGVDVVLPNR